MPVTGNYLTAGPAQYAVYVCVDVCQPVTGNYLTAGPAQYAALPVIPASLAAAAAVCSPLQASGSVSCLGHQLRNMHIEQITQCSHC